MTTTSPHLQRPDLVLPADLPGLRGVVTRLLGAGGWPMHWKVHDTCPDCGGKARGYRKGGDGEFWNDGNSPSDVTIERFGVSSVIINHGYSWWHCPSCKKRGTNGYVRRQVLPLEYGFGTMAAVEWLATGRQRPALFTAAAMRYFYDSLDDFFDLRIPGWDWNDDDQWGEDAYTGGKLPDGREVNGVEALRRLCLFTAGLPFKNDEEK